MQDEPYFTRLESYRMESTVPATQSASQLKSTDSEGSLSSTSSMNDANKVLVESMEMHHSRATNDVVQWI